MIKMKYPEILFAFLIISLSYILWDYLNVGILSFILRGEILNLIFIIIFFIFSIYKGQKLLGYCNLYNLLISFIVLFSIITLITILICQNGGMKKDLAIVFSPLYIFSLFSLFMPVKDKKMIFHFGYFIPEGLAFVYSIVYFCLRQKMNFSTDFLSFLFSVSLGFICSVCTLCLLFRKLLHKRSVPSAVNKSLDTNRDT